MKGNARIRAVPQRRDGRREPVVVETLMRLRGKPVGHVQVQRQDEAQLAWSGSQARDIGKRGNPSMRQCEAVPSLLDQFRPNVHDAPVTAAAFDPQSGTIATADADGVVAVTRRGERSPGLVIRPGTHVEHALGFVRGGSLLAVGDEAGSVGVYRTETGEEVFREVRGGQRGRVRAMRGMAISPGGTWLAAIAQDGLIRLWDLQRSQREVAWQGFGGRTVEFDARGDRLLCVDKDGQPRLIDLRNREGLPMDRLQMPAEMARFTSDNTYVVCAGPSGISLLRVVDGVLCASFATRGGSGIQSVQLSSDGRQAAAVTTRSVHTFSLPDLAPGNSWSHGAPSPSGAAYWGKEGVRVGGADGILHGGSAGRGVPPVISACGVGPHRVAVHGEYLVLWLKRRRVGVIKTPGEVTVAAVDRDGLLVATSGAGAPVCAWSAKKGQKLFDGGPGTVGAQQVAVGGDVVAAMLAEGGLRWWELKGNQAFQLKWPTAMALSGSGTWLGVVTPRGAIRILDPRTGRDALHPPVPLADAPIRRLAFVNRRPDLLVVDEEGVLGHYDLAAPIREGVPGEGRDILDFRVTIDALWGITGGKLCALRIPDGDRATVLFVDLERCDVVHEVTGLHPRTWVDAENGTVLEPAPGGAMLERNPDGSELRVSRSLPGDQWVCFAQNGILEASEAAAGALTVGAGSD